MILIISECYANSCFGEYVKKALLENVKISRIKIAHKVVWGRDRILKELYKYAHNKTGRYIAIIDYEKGKAREYINRNFKLQYLNPLGNTSGIKIYAGKFIKSSNVIAIIFDPNIEEGLLCRLNSKLCKDNLIGTIKSKSACKIIKDSIDEDTLLRISSNLINELLKSLPL